MRRPGGIAGVVCAVKGYRLRIVSHDAIAEEKISTMRAFGADVEVVHSPEGITPDLIPTMMRWAPESRAFATDQVNNADMVEGYRGLGEGLPAQLPGPAAISAFCSCVGTAGCFMGTTGALVERWPDLHRVVVEPDESAVLSGRPAGIHHIEGGGVGRWPPKLAEDSFDEVVAVPGRKAFAMARESARAEGIFSGPSTGVDLVAALHLARRLGPGHRVVTVQVDSGLKYLCRDVYGQ